MKTASEVLQESISVEQDERLVHASMRRFVERWAPSDRREAAEFHADLTLVLQSVHRDASRTTNAILTTALAAMPPAPIYTQKIKE